MTCGISHSVRSFRRHCVQVGEGDSRVGLCLLVGRVSVLVPLIVDEGWFALMQA